MSNVIEFYNKRDEARKALQDFALKHHDECGTSTIYDDFITFDEIWTGGPHEANMRRAVDCEEYYTVKFSTLDESRKHHYDIDALIQRYCRLRDTVEAHENGDDSLMFFLSWTPNKGDAS